MASLRTTGSRGPPDRHFYVAHPVRWPCGLPRTTFDSGRKIGIIMCFRGSDAKRDLGGTDDAVASVWICAVLPNPSSGPRAESLRRHMAGRSWFGSTADQT